MVQHPLNEDQKNRKMKAITTLVLGLLLCLGARAQNSSMSKQIQAMASEKDPKMNVLSMQRLIKDFKLDTLKNAEEIDVLKGQVALSFLKAGDMKQFESYIHQIRNKFNQTSYLNMAVYDLLKNKQLAYAHTLAQKTVKLYEAIKEEPAARPADFPLADWNRFMHMAAYPYYETYAEVLQAQGEVKQALYYQEKAIKDMDIDKLMITSVALYANLLEANGQVDKAYAILRQMVSSGKASIPMNKQFKKILIDKMGTQKTLLLLDSIQKNIDQVNQMEIAKKMINELDAPHFNLQDLNGKNVSLNALKGKVVVIDFWATWCAPCIASMPAMQQMSKRHPEVVFLFIATKETGKDASARIKAYVEKEKFPINVLIDRPDVKDPKVFPIAEAYQLKGLPTKVVIDKKGKLRFSTEGYASDAELINELEAMITLSQKL